MSKKQRVVFEFGTHNPGASEPPVRSSPLVRRSDLGLVTRLVRVTDHAATGQLMREARLKAGLSLRAMARRLGLSAPFISDLERGRRSWDEGRVERYAGVLVTPNNDIRDPAQ